MEDCPIHGKRRLDRKMREDDEEDFRGGVGGNNEFRSSLRRDKENEHERRGSADSLRMSEKRKKRLGRVERESHYKEIDEQNYRFHLTEYGSTKRKQDSIEDALNRPKPVKKSKPIPDGIDGNFRYRETREVRKGKKTTKPINDDEYKRYKLKEEEKLRSKPKKEENVDDDDNYKYYETVEIKNPDSKKSRQSIVHHQRRKSVDKEGLGLRSFGNDRYNFNRPNPTPTPKPKRYCPIHGDY